MKLATLKNNTRDGNLVVVNRKGSHFLEADSVSKTLQIALETWEKSEGPLQQIFDKVQKGEGKPLKIEDLHSPLPRSYEWVDGSAYLNHVRLVRKARGAEPPATLETDPLVYQGGSGHFLFPTEPWKLTDEKWGLDFEAEVCVILGDTPQGTTAAKAQKSIRLLMLCNDWTYRNIVPDELAKGFGFFQSKPATTFSPFAITPDELGSAWKEGRVHFRLQSTFNGNLIGDPEAGPEMHFSFFDLISHITKTRSFCAGTILGSGTVSNTDRARGISCLAERRMIETIEKGKPITPFMKVGDTISIEMRNEKGENLFGTISQKVVSG